MFCFHTDFGMDSSSPPWYSLCGISSLIKQGYFRLPTGLWAVSCCSIFTGLVVLSGLPPWLISAETLPTFWFSTFPAQIRSFNMRNQYHHHINRYTQSSYLYWSCYPDTSFLVNPRMRSLVLWTCKVQYFENIHTISASICPLEYVKKTSILCL